MAKSQEQQAQDELAQLMEAERRLLNADSHNSAAKSKLYAMDQRIRKLLASMVPKKRSDWPSHFRGFAS